MTEVPAYDNLAIIRKLERLPDYVGKEVDDESRDLLAEIQDEFEALKRGAVRDGLANGERVNAQDVLDFGGYVGQDFPKTQRGCEVFASTIIIEKIGSAPNN
jgi:hypothetical protein